MPETAGKQTLMRIPSTAKLLALGEIEVGAAAVLDDAPEQKKART